jgi:hypothetical protein
LTRNTMKSLLRRSGLWRSTRRWASSVDTQVTRNMEASTLIPGGRTLGESKGGASIAWAAVQKLQSVWTPDDVLRIRSSLESAPDESESSQSAQASQAWQGQRRRGMEKLVKARISAEISIYTRLSTAATPMALAETLESLIASPPIAPWSRGICCQVFAAALSLVSQSSSRAVPRTLPKAWNVNDLSRVWKTLRLSHGFSLSFEEVEDVLEALLFAKGSVADLQEFIESLLDFDELLRAPPQVIGTFLSRCPFKTLLLSFEARMDRAILREPAVQLGLLQGLVRGKSLNDVSARLLGFRSLSLLYNPSTRLQDLHSLLTILSTRPDASLFALSEVFPFLSSVSSMATLQGGNWTAETYVCWIACAQSIADTETALRLWDSAVDRGFGSSETLQSAMAPFWTLAEAQSVRDSFPLGQAR